MPRNRTGLTTAFQITTISALICLSLMIMGMNIFLDARYFQSHVEKMRTDFVHQQKELVKREVLQVIDLIREQRSNVKRQAREQVKARTREAFSIARNLYRENKDQKTLQEIQQIIVAALRPIRYGQDGSGYFFMTRLDGREILLADRPQLEGTNISDLQDSRGRFIIKDMIDIARDLGEGFYEYLWTKPGVKGEDYEKISYVKYFAPLNCFIGTGLYYQDIDRQIQESLLRTISQITFGPDGYIFVNTLDGDCLVSNGEICAGQGKLWEVFNKNPEKTKDLYLLERRAALREDGDYIEYTFNKPTAPDEQFPKTSFIYGLPDLNWLVGAGVYLDEVEESIAELEKGMKNTRFSSIKAGIFLTLALSLLIIFAFQLFSRRMKKDLSSIVSVFERAAYKDKAIDSGKIYYKELAGIAESANAVLNDKQDALETLRKSEARFRDITNLLPEAVYETDSHLRVTYANQRAFELYGYVESDLGAGLHVQDLIAPEEYDKATQRIAQIMEGLSRGSHEYLCVRRDGTRFPALFHSDVIRIDGKPAGLRGVVVDLSQRKQEEQELLKLRKLESVGVLAAGIAHNFNNTLAAIIGSLEMAKRKIEQPAQVLKYLETASKASLRSRDLVSQILKYSRREDHDHGPIDLSLVVEETLNLVRPTLPATTELKYRSGQSFFIQADSNQLQEALLNLCNNAVQAMEEVGDLSIELDHVELRPEDIPPHSECRPGTYVRLSVRDTGCGMNPAILDKIFDPFFTTKGVGEGTGMGLSTVQGIVDQHGGLIKVTSAVGRGSTFALYFPRLEKLPPHDTETAFSDLPRGKERILFVDDDRLLSDLGKEMLVDLGYRVVACDSSLDGLEYFAAAPNDFDLVVSDQTMPGLTGKELIAEIKKIRPAIRTILVTGYSSKIDEESARDLGIDAFCMKPLNQMELARTVRMVLDEDD